MTAALNGCDYDAGLENSLPVRQAVRDEIRQIEQKLPDAARQQAVICGFWRDHQTPAGGPNISPYVSLALNLGPPPDFKPLVASADLPPDAAEVQGFVPLLQRFETLAGLHQLWLKHQSEYNSLILQYHEPIADVITQTDVYLKLPFSRYPAQRFEVYLEPLLAPSHADSRNYGSSYLVVVSPSRDGAVRLPEIRHTYLHFVLDSFALSHNLELKRIEPLLQEIQQAPLDRSYKQDASLLVNECLIHAIEARTSIPKSDERARQDFIQHSVQEGFVLTRYFYNALAVFEKEPRGLAEAYGDMLHGIDVQAESKRARETTFLSQATPDVVSSFGTPSQPRNLLDTAEERLVAGDADGAKRLAEQVLDDRRTTEDRGRASFILARIATRSGDMRSASQYFEQAVADTHDPRTLAWSHIYLGRIFDIQEKRDVAVEHYRAALQAGDAAPDTRSAAEKGLAAPYKTPVSH